MPDPAAANTSAPTEKGDLWAFPPTWFGWGAGMMVGAALAGGSPWYRWVLVAAAGLCIAIAMLVYMRKKSPSS